MIQRPYLTGFLLIIAVITSISLWLLRPKPVPPPQTDRSDYRLIDYSMIALEEDGSEGFDVRGPELYREIDGKSMTLRTPRFGFPANEGGRWIATSNSAWIGEGQDEVRLNGDVDLLGPPNLRGLQTRFVTDALTIFPPKDQAKTDQPVTITRGDSILRARGLAVDMKTKRYELLADVKARLTPDRR